MDKIKLVWEGKRDGKATVTGATTETTLAMPTKIKGSGEGFTPKELTAAASSGCLIATLVANFEARKLDVLSQEIQTEIDNVDNVLTYTHYVRLTLPSDASQEDIDAVSRTIDSSERTCSVGKILTAGGVRINIVKEITLK